MNKCETCKNLSKQENYFYCPVIYGFFDVEQEYGMGSKIVFASDYNIETFGCVFWEKDNE